MGLHRIGCRDSVIFDADFLGTQHRPGVPGTLRHYFGCRCNINVLLAGHYKYWHDHGIGAGGRCPLAVDQLWGIVGSNHGDRYRIVDEYKHAAIYD